MRTIKFLGFAVALAVAAIPAFAQGGLQRGAFPGIDRYARFEARRLEHMQQMRRWHRAPSFARMRMAGRFAEGRALRRGQGWRHAGPAGRGTGMRVGVRAGARAGYLAGQRAGMRAGMRANATPAQKAFAKEFRAQRQAVRAQVRDGKLTRQQAREQMQAWAMEHRPKP